MILPKPAAAVLAALFAMAAGPVHAEGRAEFVTCQAMVDRAAQAAPAATRPDDAALQRCRQIIRDWTLRESRMSVDENGRPLR
jgi:hypothetical protein